MNSQARIWNEGDVTFNINFFAHPHQPTYQNPSQLNRKFIIRSKCQTSSVKGGRLISQGLPPSETGSESSNGLKDLLADKDLNNNSTLVLSVPTMDYRRTLIKPMMMQITCGNSTAELLDYVSRYHTQVNQQAEQEREQENWAKVMPALHGTFVFLKSETTNWTTLDWEEDISEIFCDWKEDICCYLTVDLIDLTVQKQRQIRFCQCTPDLLHLLAHGYLGSLPCSPQTAFSLNLLGCHNHLWQWCTIGNLPFMNAMQAWLKEQSNPLLTNSGKLSRQEILARESCPACFGPTIGAASHPCTSASMEISNNAITLQPARIT
ncbi:hypothetical protein PSTG_08808 [Puccinia striiformis f. sp. tritici PST-78]|uniref:CxC1-like cysteine cluster associated with KDZ transposases domain-containing protein n=1 Tax=Puccinia striiformis f. sp. tritici PST-78 TaxID=1165861 RepID=A0A0L0VF82_9BASI|nr:hypothetical protein PSTG_08808 [Puccinia striiformis f. sp. tritici PST-78]